MQSVFQETDIKILIRYFLWLKAFNKKKTLGFPRATIFGEGGIRTPGPGISRSTP